jgi:hypothetical protein
MASGKHLTAVLRIASTEGDGLGGLRGGHPHQTEVARGGPPPQQEAARGPSTTEVSAV